VPDPFDDSFRELEIGRGKIRMDGFHRERDQGQSEFRDFQHLLGQERFDEELGKAKTAAISVGHDVRFFHNSF
jgi:hypothetical protein